ncbi:MAG: hypothetical protein OHK0052_17200 [Anaerolineales bacterium]
MTDHTPNTLPPSLQFFSVSEVAIILNVGDRLIRKWINAGILSVFRLGNESRLIRIRRQDLEAFIQHNVQASLTPQDEATP